MESLVALLLRLPQSIACRVRILFWRSLGMQIGPHCRFESIRVRRPAQISVGAGTSLTAGCWLWPEDRARPGLRIEIGRYNYFNRDVMIDACGYIKIGDHTMFGPRVYVTDSNHTMPPGCWVGESPMDVGRVVIGDGCWIGAGATILKDVRLGERCIVAAGAVVTKSFPAGSVIAGIPAKLIRTQSVVEAGL